MPTLTARAWKTFYAEERAQLGPRGLDALLERAPELPSARAAIFPHARLRFCGEQLASAAQWALASGADTVLALGVLHGAREQDRALVERARAGEVDALAALRRFHGQDSHASEEFSLDNFEVLLERAAQRVGRRAPRLVKRFPFLVGEQPETMPGLDELRALVDGGAALVATTDPIHHGAGYDTPLAAQRGADEPSTRAFALESIERSYALLAQRDFAAFQAHTAAFRSDFRDTGPVLAALTGFTTFAIHALELVPYGDVLGAPEPTWVAAALASVGC